MNVEIPGWLIALMSALGSGVGAWVAVKVSVTRLETQMQGVLQKVDKHSEIVTRHNEDILAHDMEIEVAMGKLGLLRARRQTIRNL